MKKFFAMLAIAAFVTACNNEGEGTVTEDTTTTMGADTTMNHTDTTMNMDTTTIITDTTAQ